MYGDIVVMRKRIKCQQRKLRCEHAYVVTPRRRVEAESPRAIDEPWSCTDGPMQPSGKGVHSTSGTVLRAEQGQPSAK